MISSNPMNDFNKPMKFDMDFLFDDEDPDDIRRRIERKERQSKIDELLKEEKNNKYD